MKKSRFLFITILLVAGMDLSAQKENAVVVNQLVIVANNPGPVISKDIRLPGRRIRDPYLHNAQATGNCPAVFNRFIAYFHQIGRAHV